MRNVSNIAFDRRYPSVEDLQARARRRIPAFAFDYLDGGCNEGVSLARNRAELQQVQLKPSYLKPYAGCSLETEIFGQKYAAPFGIAPIGLQGLIWPGAPEILARAAREQGLPFVLSTVGTAPLERIAEVSEGTAWFQFYHPADAQVRDDLLRRAEAAGYQVLVLLCDTPTFGFRPGEIRSGLSMPPRMTLSNFGQMLGRPRWLLKTLQTGAPRFANLQPYMPGKLDLAGLGGIVVSNHGGRQLDAGPSSMAALQQIAPMYASRMTVMIDSGLRSGPDIARCLATGAAFTFLGRPFMYGVGALGDRGGNHVAGLLKTQLRQVMEQVGCERVADLPAHLL